VESKTSDLPPVDVNDCCPEQTVGWEPNSKDSELIIVLRPRFISGPLAWWLQPRLIRPHFKVRLDPVGTFVWSHCDGKTKVSEIAVAMQEHFGDDFEQAEERLQRFLFELERGKMIRMVVPGRPAE
jgi:Coenzyme PQQ synthesis protein D (PqqD)